MIWSNYQFCLPFLGQTHKGFHEGRKAINNYWKCRTNFWNNFSLARTFSGWPRIIFYVCKPRLGLIWASDSNSRSNNYCSRGNNEQDKERLISKNQSLIKPRWNNEMVVSLSVQQVKFSPSIAKTTVFHMSEE